MVVRAKLPPITLSPAALPSTKLIGARIAARRRELKLTQGALAEMAGVGISTISSLEQGGQGTRHLERLAAALQVQSHWLLYGYPTKVAPQAVLAGPAGAVLRAKPSGAYKVKDADD